MKKQYFTPCFEVENLAVADVITMSTIDGEARDITLSYLDIIGG